MRKGPAAVCRGGFRVRVPAALVALLIAAALGSSSSVASPICPCSLLPAGLTPASTGLSTANGRSGGPWTLEVGVRFTVDAPARLATLGFYKDAAEAGAHVGRLWTGDGVLLASVPFAGESASGPQVQALPTPVALAPGTVYVAS